MIRPSGCSGDGLAEGANSGTNPGDLAERANSGEVADLGFPQHQVARPDEPRAHSAVQSYGRPNTGKVAKVDIPQLQEARRASRRKDHGRRGEVQRQAGPKSSHHPTLLHFLSAEKTAGELAHTGLNQPCPLSRHGGRPLLLGRHKNFTPTFLALERGPMSQERPFGNSGAEHRSEPNHPQQAEEVTTAGPTPNRFWRMMTDPGFPSPASNPVSFVVTAEAFLGLTNQSPVAPNRETQLEVEPPQRQAAEAHAASPTAAPARSQSCSCGPVQTSPDFDTLSSDFADSLREQVRQVHQRLDEVHKEVLKSKGEIRESSKGGSPFTPEIQDKPLPANFRLPTLELYDGSCDPIEHIAAFRAQMALRVRTKLLGEYTPKIDHRFPPGVGPRKRRVLSQFVGRFTSQRNNPEDTPRDRQRGGTGRACSIGTPPPDPPQLDSNRDLFSDSGEGALEGSKSNEDTLRKTRQKEVLSYGHDMEECRDLQYQIEDLIRHGHLRRYVRDQSSLPASRPPRDPSPRPKGLVEKKIDVIFGRPTSGNNSSSIRKAYACTEVEKRLAHYEDLDITFRSGSEEYPCHDVALVISIQMANACVKRVMIDTESSTDILYFDSFQKLGLTDKDLVTLISTLTGFTRDFVSPMGAAMIPVMFGGESMSKTLMVSFMVVKLLSAYNAITERSTLNRLKAIVSTYHRLMKFPT
ncbi:hypothetical protein BHE74_00002485 [Ensete ventricosum]|nr:hypothetical protein BHE74_00002485 [Ensete ventricosum]